MILPKQYSGNTVQILFLKSMKKLIIFFQFKAYLKMNWAVCKTPWSHRIFYTTYCQISQASGFVLRKGKNSPPEPSLPVARLKLGTLLPWLCPLPGEGQDAKGSWARAGFQQQLCLCFSCSSWLCLPFSWVSPPHPQPPVSSSTPLSPWHFPSCLSRCFQLLMALSGTAAPTLLCLWAPCSVSPQLGGHRALWDPLHSAALLQCLASIRKPEFLQRNPIAVLITAFVWCNFFPL